MIKIIKLKAQVKLLRLKIKIKIIVISSHYTICNLEQFLFHLKNKCCRCKKIKALMDFFNQSYQYSH